MTPPSQQDTRSNDFVLHSDLTGLRADMQETNRNVERIANAVETIIGDHEHRIREVETKIVAAMSIVNLVKWIGPGALATLVVLLAKMQGAF